MSGGSWNYVHIKIESGEAVEASTVEKMATAVEKYGPEAWKVARRIRVAAELLEAAATMLKATAPVFMAVEWHESGDWGPERVLEACREVDQGGASGGGT